MKNGTFYAKRVKRFFSKLKQEYENPELPEPSDPVRTLAVGLLSRETSQENAERALDSLFEVMVDYNELRVSTIPEISEQIEPYVPNPAKRADALRRVLNAIYQKQHRISLDRLHKLGRREARHYLDHLDGMDAHAAASVVLWSLGGHAVPVDVRMLERLREEELVEPSASIEEVQAFLERNIAATDARQFCILMRRYVDATAAKEGAGATGGNSTKRKPRKSRRGGSGGKKKSSKKSSSKTDDESRSG
jgi:endonuclease III